jgi:DNA-binding NarL/FixJ family response regulator
LIADSQLLFRRGLRALFSAEGDLEVIGEAATLEEALLKERLLGPDVLVMGLDLLYTADQASVAAIRRTHSKTALLLLSHTDSPAELEMAMATGAQGYMLKGSTAPQLIGGIRQTIASRDQGMESMVRSASDLRALAANNTPQPAKSVLTMREQEVVRLLAEGRTVRQVAAELNLSVKTVEAHKLNLMRKLDIHNRSEVVQYAMANGLVAAQMAHQN